MCLRIASPAINRVGNDCRRGLSSYTAPNCCSGNNQSIVRKNFHQRVVYVDDRFHPRGRRRDRSVLSPVVPFGRIVSFDASKRNDLRFERIARMKLQDSVTSNPKSLQSQMPLRPEIDFRLMN